MCCDVSFQIGASYHQTNVSVWVVDLEHLENLITKYNDETANVGNNLGGGEFFL